MAYLARLKLLSGHCNSLGLPEAAFKHPLSGDLAELHQRALKQMEERPFQLGIYWSLIEPARRKEFSTYLEKEAGAVMKRLIHIIMHGWIYFSDDAEFPVSHNPQIDPLVDLCVRAGIPLDAKAIDWFFRERLNTAKALHYEIPQAEILQETKATFARNITMVYIK